MMRQIFEEMCILVDCLQDSERHCSTAHWLPTPNHDVSAGKMMAWYEIEVDFPKFRKQNFLFGVVMSGMPVCF